MDRDRPTGDERSAAMALKYFEEGEAAEVDAAALRYRVEQAGEWDFKVSGIARNGSTLT